MTMNERHYPTDEGRCFECGKPWLTYPTCDGGAAAVVSENERLRGRMVDAAAELASAHYLDEHGHLCVTCGAADGSWPCGSRQVADELSYM